jgi:hypothetical protein
MTSRIATFLGYGTILVLIDVWATVTARSPRWLTLPDAFTLLTRSRTARILVVLGWIWLGWHLFARGSGAFK